MAVTDSFVAFVVEQLDPLGPIASKRMLAASPSKENSLVSVAPAKLPVLPCRQIAGFQASTEVRVAVCAVWVTSERLRLVRRPVSPPYITLDRN
jgi:hypothetical protein